MPEAAKTAKTKLTQRYDTKTKNGVLPRVFLKLKTSDVCSFQVPGRLWPAGASESRRSA